jgi:acetylornithine deacetylase/succinyl-diaminopimelate desuccinylase-like protein
MTADREAVLAAAGDWVDDHADELLELLAALVARPAGSGEEGLATGDGPVAVLHEFLDGREGVALDTQRIADDYVEGPRENLYATVDGAGRGGLVCTSHTDVVPAGDPADWPADPFELTPGEVRYRGGTDVELTVAGQRYERSIREKMARIWRERDRERADVLVGRGAFDNKAASVCMAGSLLALSAALRARGASLAGSLVHGHLVDEETYQVGAKRMVGWEGGADWFGERYDPEAFAAVVLEGSYGFVPVVGHRGLVWLTLTAEGEAAHAATPELGRNAVVGLSRALAAAGDGAVADALGELFVEGDHLGALTVAPGTTVVGGEVRRVENRTVHREGQNSVPDWAEATFDLRVPRWEGFPEGVDSVTDRVTERVEAAASEAAPDVEFRARVPENCYFPPVALADSLEAAREHPLVERAAAATRATLGYEPGIDVAPGVTDAAFIAHGASVPTLAEYGPAGGLSHEPLEYVERQQLVRGAKTMVALALEQVGLA